MAKRHSPHGGQGVAYPYRDSIEGVPPTLVNFRCPTGCGPRPGAALPFRAFLPCFSFSIFAPKEDAHVLAFSPSETPSNAAA